MHVSHAPTTAPRMPAIVRLDTVWKSRALLLAAALLVLAVACLLHINRLLRHVPAQARELSGSRWTADQLRASYRALAKKPIDYTDKLPPKLDRRYIVTGGNGLVGGFIVLQLLARGTPPSHIRILDLRKTERGDMLNGPAAQVDFIPVDIRSAGAVSLAFSKSWPASASHLPLTVFHTAAVIIPSERHKHTYLLPESVNVQGTRNVLAASHAAGASVFSATSSAAISIVPVDLRVPFWAEAAKNACQVLDERDFDVPLRSDDGYYSNYARSKAIAERVVCSANQDDFRTGCIRPGIGVYGNPTDNTVGGPLSQNVQPSMIPHVVQTFVHAANVAVAHLHQESVLLSQAHVKDIPQAGRPFAVTDPNPAIAYADIYTAISALSIYPFRAQILPPAPLFIFSHLVEWYTLLRYHVPSLQKTLPPVTGVVSYLQPAIFSICTHLVVSDVAARKPVAEGGLGYEGVLTTEQGIVSEILEWNREQRAHAASQGVDGIAKAELKKAYTTSNSLADHIRALADVGNVSDVNGKLK